jgi:Zn-dependent peptidase ImmA (M78 family)
MFTINNEQWDIVLVAPYDVALLMPKGEYALGACNDATKTIYISNELHGEMFEQVLCHELVHASMFAYDVMLEHDEEELIAEIIATFGEEIIDITDIMFDKIRRGRY